MNRFIILFKKIHLFLLFAIVELCAIYYYSSATLYTNARVINASNYVIRGVNAIFNSPIQYLSLKDQNDALLDQIVLISNELEGVKGELRVIQDSLNIMRDTVFAVDSLSYELSYKKSRVVSNSTIHQHNYITISSGSNDGVQKDMILVNSGSVVGYIVDCSENYAVAISLLNRDFRTSGRDTKNSYFGSIRWDGKSLKHVTLEDIPKYSHVNVGDTIVTTEYSSRFPQGVKIGTVKNVESGTLLSVKAEVELFLDMSKIFDVVVVKNRGFDEREELENRVIKGK